MINIYKPNRKKNVTNAVSLIAFDHLDDFDRIVHTLKWCVCVCVYCLCSLNCCVCMFMSNFSENSASTHFRIRFRLCVIYVIRLLWLNGCDCYMRVRCVHIAWSVDFWIDRLKCVAFYTPVQSLRTQFERASPKDKF